MVKSDFEPRMSSIRQSEYGICLGLKYELNSRLGILNKQKQRLRSCYLVKGTKCQASVGFTGERD